MVPNGVDPEPPPSPDAPAAPVRDLLAGPPFLLYLGRLSWKKGLDRLIPALARVPGAVLAVAGNDEEGIRPKLDSLAREAGVAERVRFLGPVDGADKAALLHGCAALVLPSYSENFGNSVLEAMAAGRPVAVTPEVGLAEVVREERAGIVADGAPEALGEALRALLADPDREAMGRRGADAASRRFGWGAVAARMEEGVPGGGAAMNLAFVVERPTQFEVPFYRHAAADPVHRLQVLYTDPRGAEPVYDPELGRTVSWGFDLLGGYDHASCRMRSAQARAAPDAL